MAKKTTEPTIESVQEAYRKLAHAITAYLDAEENLVEVSRTYTKALDLTERSHTHLWNILQGKEE